ncbi:unnamed protein product [Prorocentrum cordatum]|uniref:Uncharacterized protein n=1 Tax=Prorocentrum cordatum TaxID=2364126 RepID=A0ABN9QAW9_9DINO|nr:unnamed protein product [Polarella glacialis]
MALARLGEDLQRALARLETPTGTPCTTPRETGTSAGTSTGTATPRVNDGYSSKSGLLGDWQAWWHTGQCQQDAAPGRGDRTGPAPTPASWKTPGLQAAAAQGGVAGGTDKAPELAKIASVARPPDGQSGGLAPPGGGVVHFRLVGCLRPAKPDLCRGGGVRSPVAPGRETVEERAHAAQRMPGTAAKPERDRAGERDSIGHRADEPALEPRGWETMRTLQRQLLNQSSNLAAAVKQKAMPGQCPGDAGSGASTAGSGADSGCGCSSSECEETTRSHELAPSLGVLINKGLGKAQPRHLQAAPSAARTAARAASIASIATYVRRTRRRSGSRDGRTERKREAADMDAPAAAEAPAETAAAVTFSSAAAAEAL